MKMMSNSNEKYDGLNILSYKPGTIFTGKEIKDWINWHLEHENSHKKVAKKLKKYLNIEDDLHYFLSKGDYRSSASYGQYIVVRYQYPEVCLHES